MKIRKAQSALEYLNTYMWALLVIAIVLAILFSLGAFNGFSFAPREQPGSCYVSRPYGPLTARYVQLTGACNGELPEFTADFSPALGSYVATSLGNFETNSVTVLAWIMPLTPPSGGMRIVAYGIDNCSAGGACYGWFLDIPAATPYQVTIHVMNGVQAKTLKAPVSLGRWSFVAASFVDGNVALYVDGVQASTGTYSGSVQPARYDNLVTIAETVANTGNLIRGVGVFNGSMSNVQIYNTSLSANEIMAMYIEGIGGVPINLNSLVGWWPLNSNANDYSGDNLNGYAAGNMVYTNEWTSGYTVP